MKFKTIIFLILTFTCTSIFAQSTVMFNRTTNEVVVPARDTFVEANKLVSSSNFSVLIDLQFSGVRASSASYLSSTYNSTSTTTTSYFTDIVLKVLDPDGNILYFFSTVLYWSEQLKEMHPELDYDDGAKVYYYPTGRNNDNTNGTTNLRAKQLFPYSAWSEHSIATYEEELSGQSVYAGITRGSDGRIRITAIQIYPSEQYKSLFINPENSIVVHRQSTTIAELDGNGHHVFKGVGVQY